MGLLNKFFGNKKELSEEDLKLLASEFFDRVDKYLIISDYKEAIKYVLKNYHDVEGIIKIGAPLHIKFLDTICKIKSYTSKTTNGSLFNETHNSLPSFRVITDAAEKTLKELTDSLKDAKEELIYIKFTADKSYPERDTLHDIEGLTEFKIDPKTLVMYTGPNPENFIIKKNFLFSIHEHINNSAKIKDLSAKIEEALSGKDGYDFQDAASETIFGYQIFKIKRA